MFVNNFMIFVERTFPEPVRPTTPTRCPPSMRKDARLRQRGRLDLYRTERFLTSIEPLCGQFNAFGLSSASEYNGASGRRLLYSLTRSTQTIWLTTSALCLTVHWKILPSCMSILKARPKITGSTLNQPKQ